MRLAHLADAHLGFRHYHRQTPSGINQREADVANAFRAAIDGIIADGPDAVLFAGDLFHNIRPTNSAIIFAFRQFQRLRAALPDAAIVVIAGNHDTPRSTETGTILRLFSELNIEVATDEPRRLTFPALDLSVLAVSHQAWLAPEPPVLHAEGPERHQVLLFHGEVEGLLPGDRSMEYGGALLDPAELSRSDWSYVALGHYHVTKEVAPRIWYSGALEYVSTNIWGELGDEALEGVQGKGWLLVDLETGKVTRRPIPLARGVYDLPQLDARDHPPEELDRLIHQRLQAVPGGIADQIVRLVVYNVPRHVIKELGHAAIRAAKAEALHLQIDLRPPEVSREVGVGAPGPHRTLADVVREFLAGRPLPERVDRERFVRTGLALLEQAGGDEDGG